MLWVAAPSPEEPSVLLSRQMPGYCDSEVDHLAEGEPESPVESDIGGLFDEVLASTGNFGLYQKILVFIVILPAFFIYSLGNSFWLFVIAVPADIKCGTESVEYNKTSSSLTEEFYCFMSSNSSNDNNFLGENFASVPCDAGWVYDQSMYSSTIATEWDLICDYSFMPTLVYILITTFGTLAAPAGGYISDHYGRKLTYYAFLTIQFAASIGMVLAGQFWMFVLFASIHSLAIYPTYQSLYTLGQEIVGPRQRTMLATLTGLMYALGNIGGYFCAYLVRDWRPLILYTSLPLLSMGPLWWLMPESPRYHLASGRFTEVEQFFQRVAKLNGAESDDWKQKLRRLRSAYRKNRDGNSTRSSYSLLDLFRIPKLRRRTIVLCALSATVAISCVGLDFYAPQFGSNPHLNMILTALMDLPASLVTQFMADNLGRRITLITNFFLGSLACLASALLSNSYTSALIWFLIARSFAVSNYTVEELVSCENFPTVLRGEGVSLTNSISGLISNIGPLIVYVGSRQLAVSPMILFGAVTLGGCLVVIFLPETAHESLPETVEDFKDYKHLSTWQELVRPVKRRFGNTRCENHERGGV